MPQLANADLVIWGIIIVVSIVGQIIKAAGQKTKATLQVEEEDPHRDHGSSSPARRRSARNQGEDPNSEIRQFLESIGGTAAAKPSPRKQQAQRRVAKPAGVPPKSRKVAHDPAVARKHSLQEMAKAAFANSVEVESPATPTRKQTTPVAAQTRSDLQKLLQNRKSTRQAVLLREILGPPHGLRRQQSHQHA